MWHPESSHDGLPPPAGSIKDPRITFFGFPFLSLTLPPSTYSSDYELPIASKAMQSSRPTAPMPIASRSYPGSRTSIRRLPPLPSSPDSSCSSSSDETERPPRGPRPTSTSSTDSSSSDETVLSPYHPQRAWKRESRRTSSIRPLPPIPRALRCRRCATTVTSINLLLPLHDVRLPCLYARPNQTILHVFLADS